MESGSIRMTGNGNSGKANMAIGGWEGGLIIPLIILAWVVSCVSISPANADAMKSLNGSS